MRARGPLSLALLLSASPAHAQPVQPLERISTVQLVIEKLNPSAETCGATERLIRESFLYPVSSSRLKVATNAGVPVVYINVLVHHQNIGCFSTILMQVYTYQNVTIQASHNTTFAKVELWHDGTLLVGPHDRFAAGLRTNIEELTKAFLTEWNLANKR